MSVKKLLKDAQKVRPGVKENITYIVFPVIIENLGNRSNINSSFRAKILKGFIECTLCLKSLTREKEIWKYIDGYEEKPLHFDINISCNSYLSVGGSDR